MPAWPRRGRTIRDLQHTNGQLISRLSYYQLPFAHHSLIRLHPSILHPGGRKSRQASLAFPLARPIAQHSFKMLSKSVRQAEKKALEGANESQDTLVVAHYLMLDYGVGLVSCGVVGPSCSAGFQAIRQSNHCETPCREAAHQLLAKSCLCPHQNEARSRAREAVEIVSSCTSLIALSELCIASSS